jgi:hypothetical protein
LLYIYIDFRGRIDPYLGLGRATMIDVRKEPTAKARTQNRFMNMIIPLNSI